MPALNQNFTRLESDSYVLEFTPTDGVITSSTYAAWWGVSNTDTAAGSLLLKGWTNNSNGSIPGLTSYDSSNSCENTPSSGTLPINGTGSDVNPKINNNDNTIRIIISQAQQDLITPNGTYYHELVLMKIALNTAFQCISHVAASGFITVENSIFTNRTYR